MNNNKAASMVTCSPGFVYFVGDNKQKTLGKIEPTMEPKSKIFSFWKKYRNKENKRNNKNIPIRHTANDAVAPTPPSSRDEIRNQKKSSCGALPSFLAFLAAFSTVTALLLVWCQSTALRRQAFDVTLTKDNILVNISMDDAQLIQYIQYMLLTTINRESLNTTQSHEEEVVASLSQNKTNGTYLEYLSRSGAPSTTAWLDTHLNWKGVIVIPDSKSYFKIIRTSRNPETRIIQACLSTDTETKEISLSHESNVQVTEVSKGSNSYSFLEDNLPERVKSFTLYSVLLAYNSTVLDYLSLIGQDLQDLKVLDTIPWDKVKISTIFIHWNAQHSEEETKNVIKKLADRHYKYIPMPDANKLMFHYKGQFKI